MVQLRYIITLLLLLSTSPGCAEENNENTTSLTASADRPKKIYRKIEPAHSHVKPYCVTSKDKADIDAFINKWRSYVANNHLTNIKDSIVFPLNDYYHDEKFSSKRFDNLNLITAFDDEIIESENNIIKGKLSFIKDYDCKLYKITVSESEEDSPEIIYLLGRTKRGIKIISFTSF